MTTNTGTHNLAIPTYRVRMISNPSFEATHSSNPL